MVCPKIRFAFKRGNAIKDRSRLVVLDSAETAGGLCLNFARAPAKIRFNSLSGPTYLLPTTNRGQVHFYGRFTNRIALEVTADCCRVVDRCRLRQCRPSSDSRSRL